MKHNEVEFIDSLKTYITERILISTCKSQENMDALYKKLLIEYNLNKVNKAGEKDLNLVVDIGEKLIDKFIFETKYIVKNRTYDVFN